MSLTKEAPVKPLSLSGDLRYREMKLSSEDLKVAFIAISIGLEPVIFAVVGWYVGPRLNLTNTTGALIGVVVGLGVMFWRIWKLSSMLGLRARHDPEREDLRPLASFIEVKRHKVIDKSKIVKIVDAHTPPQLLATLRDLSLIGHDFYLRKLDEVLNEVVDFSKTLSEVWAQSSINFIKALKAFNDFLTTLCVNFAFRYEVDGDRLAKGYVVLPFKFEEADVRGLLHEGLVRHLTDGEIKELYPKAFKEALTINSRAPLLALSAYSLMKMGEVLEANGYGRAYSREVNRLALELFSIAVNELRAKSEESDVVKMIKQKGKLTKVRVKEFRKGVLKREEDVLRFFINEAHRVLASSARVPPTARAVLSYLFVEWGKKVSLKLAIMAANNEITPRDALASLMIPC